MAVSADGRYGGPGAVRDSRAPQRRNNDAMSSVASPETTEAMGQNCHLVWYADEGRHADHQREVRGTAAVVGRTSPVPVGGDRSPRHRSRRDRAGVGGDRHGTQHGARRLAGTGRYRIAWSASGAGWAATPTGRGPQAVDRRDPELRSALERLIETGHLWRPDESAALDLQVGRETGRATDRRRSSGERADGEPAAARVGVPVADRPQDAGRASACRPGRAVQSHQRALPGVPGTGAGGDFGGHEEEGIV